MRETKVIALDDDPTGCQTVHSCLLLTRWDVATLKAALTDPAPIFFVLTNTRAMDAARAAARTREVCRHLGEALAVLRAEGRAITPILVSRSDSTLRGHYPVETDAIAAALGPFDAHFLVPAFFEGGRITRDAVHYVMLDGAPVPAHLTEFARDSVFGYHHSYLPDYVAEKTGGAIRADEVAHFGLPEVRAGSLDRLLDLTGNRCCVVDAEVQADLDRFAADLLAASERGKRFLFRSGASLLTALTRLPPQPVPAEQMGRYVRAGRPGAVIVGSHVRKTTEQLAALLEAPGTTPIEIDVGRVDTDRTALLRETTNRAAQAHQAGLTPVIFTSREELSFPSQAERLAFGERVSAFLMDGVRALPATLGFLISKGGITSNDVLSDGLALRTSRVLGQILAGCSVVRCPLDHPRFPGLPVVIFPGNVGDAGSLRRVYERLAAGVDAPALAKAIAQG